MNPGYEQLLKPYLLPFHQEQKKSDWISIAIQIVCCSCQRWHLKILTVFSTDFESSISKAKQLNLQSLL